MSYLKCSTKQISKNADRSPRNRSRVILIILIIIHWLLHYRKVIKIIIFDILLLNIVIWDILAHVSFFKKLFTNHLLMNFYLNALHNFTLFIIINSLYVLLSF